MAWIIGWDLILEYAVGAATVGIAWSEYLNNLLVNVLHTSPIPFALSHSPFQTDLATGEHGLINLPAFLLGFDLSTLAAFTAFPMFASFQVALEKYFLQALVPEGAVAQRQPKPVVPPKPDAISLPPISKRSPKTAMPPLP
mgnify:CR=1 FL=1